MRLSPAFPLHKESEMRRRSADCRHLGITPIELPVVNGAASQQPAAIGS
jgi:hypothetical protein